MIRTVIETTFITIFLLSTFVSLAQDRKAYDAIYSGIPWLDDRGKVVSAHGTNIVKDNDKYYLLGSIKPTLQIYLMAFPVIHLPTCITGNLSA